MIVRYHWFLLRVLVFYLAGIALLYGALLGPVWVIGLSLGLIIFGTLFFQGRDAQFRSMYSSHWARPEEIKDARLDLSKLTGQEVLLGFAYGEPLGLRMGLSGRKEMGHLSVVGPTRAGKGLHAIAELLNWRGSAVVIDIKGEFYNKTSGYRHQVMKQKVYALNPSSGAPTNQFDPFAERDTPEQLQATAETILNPDADGSNKAFALRASFALLAMMLVAKERGWMVLPFVRECLSIGPEKSMLMLEEMSTDPEVARNLVFFIGSKPSEYNWAGFGNDKFLNNSWINLIAKMKYLMGGGIIDMTSGSDFKSTDLLHEPTTLYMVFRESDLAYTVHAFSAIILSIIESIIKYYDLHPDEDFVPIKFLFDEAGRIVVPKLDELISTVAGRGMIVVVYVQSLAQLDKLYGEDGADTIKSGTHTKIYYTPKDATTAKYLSDNGGRYMFEDQRSSRNDDSHSDTVGLNSRELITVDEALKMEAGRIIIASNEFPYIAGYRMEPFVLPQAQVARTLTPPPIVRKNGTSPTSQAPARFAADFSSTQPAPVVHPGLEALNATQGVAPARFPGLTLDDAPSVPMMQVDLDSQTTPAPPILLDTSDMDEELAAFDLALKR
jgi:type IV secretion system protein VirD4